MAIRPCYPFQEVSWALSHSAALQPQTPVLSASGCQWGENQGKRHIEQFMLSAQKAFDILFHVTLGIFGQYKTTGCKDLDTVPCPELLLLQGEHVHRKCNTTATAWDTACGCFSVLHLASQMVQGVSNALPASFCVRCVSYIHIMDSNNKNNNMYYFITYWFPLIPPLFYHFNWVPSLVLSVHYTSYLLSPVSFI